MASQLQVLRSFKGWINFRDSSWLHLKTIWLCYRNWLARMNQTTWLSCRKSNMTWSRICKSRAEKASQKLSRRDKKRCFSWLGSKLTFPRALCSYPMQSCICRTCWWPFRMRYPMSVDTHCFTSLLPRHTLSTCSSHIMRLLVVSSSNNNCSSKSQRRSKKVWWLERRDSSIPRLSSQHHNKTSTASIEMFMIECKCSLISLLVSNLFLLST